jgi:hypothetical protein
VVREQLRRPAGVAGARRNGLAIDDIDSSGELEAVRLAQKVQAILNQMT